MPSYWLLKTEPGEYAYTDLEREGVTRWDGVRNHQAKRNLQAMAVGDWALIYHSVSEKAVVGLAQVSHAAYPDPTDNPTGTWVVVDVEPRQRLPQPVSLAQIKAEPSLQQLALIRQSRLSVMPVTEAEFQSLLSLGGLSSPVAIA